MYPFKKKKIEEETTYSHISQTFRLTVEWDYKGDNSQHQACGLIINNKAIPKEINILLDSLSFRVLFRRSPSCFTCIFVCHVSIIPYETSLGEIKKMTVSTRHNHLSLIFEFSILYDFSTTLSHYFQNLIADFLAFNLISNFYSRCRIHFFK